MVVDENDYQVEPDTNLTVVKMKQIARSLVAAT